ncbi:MAG: GtrA family protein [Muribaculaceae bacterium]|nr:GtrA family protein [Muribaculaceae bacterium]
MSLNLKKLIFSDSRLSEIIRFCLVGGTATVIQYGVYVVFVDAVHVKAVPSTLISYGISFIFNYFLSSFFTFHKKPSAHNILGFIGSHAINMGVQTGLVAIFKGIVGNTLALLPALAICIPLNYLMVRYVFNHNIFKQWKRN